MLTDLISKFFVLFAAVLTLVCMGAIVINAIKFYRVKDSDSRTKQMELIKTIAIQAALGIGVLFFSFFLNDVVFKDWIFKGKGKALVEAGTELVKLATSFWGSLTP